MNGEGQSEAARVRWVFPGQTSPPIRFVWSPADATFPLASAVSTYCTTAPSSSVGRPPTARSPPTCLCHQRDSRNVGWACGENKNKNFTSWCRTGSAPFLFILSRLVPQTNSKKKKHQCVCSSMARKVHYYFFDCLPKLPEGPGKAALHDVTGGTRTRSQVSVPHLRPACSLPLFSSACLGHQCRKLQTEG